MRTFFATFVISLFLLSPVWAFAATAVIEVNTKGEEINALEGTLALPKGMRAHVAVGGSIISLWVEEPQLKDGMVRFSGITPGGFEGVHSVFTIQGEFTPRDLEGARFEDVVALKNDGTGERVPVSLSFSLTPFRADTEPPESFMPSISSDPALFDGKYFLVFTTQDKNSGIRRYEVREGRFGFWREAESPYPLTHQRLDRNIYVKAIDDAGNERVAIVPATESHAWWESYGLFAILIVLVLGALAYKRQWLKFTK